MVGKVAWNYYPIQATSPPNMLANQFLTFCIISKASFVLDRRESKA